MTLLRTGLVPIATCAAAYTAASNRRAGAGAPLASRWTVVKGSRQMPVFEVCALAALALVATCAWPAGVLARGPGGDLQIRVLSNRADLTSGGQALVEVGLPSGVRPGAVRLRLGDADVTADFGKRANGRFEGLVDDLRLGRNVLTVSAPGGLNDRAVIRNHPIGGPVFSGPQAQPWACQNGSDHPKCNAPTTY
jgi:hypothetical protein